MRPVERQFIDLLSDFIQDHKSTFTNDEGFSQLNEESRKFLYHLYDNGVGIKRLKPKKR